MSHFFRFPALFLIAVLVTCQAFSQEKKPLHLEALLKEALENNPRLRAARNQTAAARTRVDQVTSWDAPQFGVEFFQTPVQSFPNPLKSQMEMDYFIQQMFPFP
ncbi:MAG: TolC family protein, partial [Bacteroidota bacterium]